MKKSGNDGKKSKSKKKPNAADASQKKLSFISREPLVKKKESQDAKQEEPRQPAKND
jgi:hypothetical protein